LTALTGKRYFEGVFTAGTTGTANMAVGVANASGNNESSLGFSDANAWAYWGTNTGARSANVTVIAQASAIGDVIGVAVDEPNHKLWLRKNGTWLQGDPATDTSPIWSNLSGTLYAAACPWGASNVVVTMRFDPTTFRDAAPTGFLPVYL
jgi:exo-beta-1,3-glucanase (GH17 family)